MERKAALAVGRQVGVEEEDGAVGEDEFAVAIGRRRHQVAGDDALHFLAAECAVDGQRPARGQQVVEGLRQQLGFQDRAAVEHSR